MDHNVTGNGERDGLKTVRIGQSAAKHPHGVKVQRLGESRRAERSEKRGQASRPIAERFKNMVQEMPSGCHEWTGHVMPNGYGQVRHNGTAYAHRVAYELHRGAVPEGLYVLHRCDNRKCVNPEHLFLGTFNDNMADMVEKQRQAHGERNGHAKLTDDQVRAIRRAVGTQREIAKQFGVTPSLISMIRSRRIWRLV